MIRAFVACSSTCRSCARAGGGAARRGVFMWTVWAREPKILELLSVLINTLSKDGSILLPYFFRLNNPSSYKVGRIIRIILASFYSSYTLQNSMLARIAPAISKPIKEREEFWANVQDVLVKCDRNKRIVILDKFIG
ncbi:hypothetical protein EVAR_97455_1 [Eumeta japonica]|uniref:Uncharacterized protein n=1 Tax=Eumeta variegata TaxID=151549 RepID=A0A4C1X102_EUMVA|nr:hypothetical protein EVAR_97455_1 [Eumeta japonica]